MSGQYVVEFMQNYWVYGVWTIGGCVILLIYQLPCSKKVIETFSISRMHCVQLPLQDDAVTLYKGFHG